MSALGQLQRRDLTGFDDQSRRLVLEMQAAGWTSRLSARGHVVMHAPDGVTTAAVSRKAKHQNRSGANARAKFTRWLREHPEAVQPPERKSKPQPVPPAEPQARVEPTPQPVHTVEGTTGMTQLLKCPDCDRTFEHHRQLSGHRLQVHRENRCVDCGELFATLGALTSHRQRNHLPDGTVFTCTICARTFETAQGLGGHMGGHRRAGTATTSRDHQPPTPLAPPVQPRPVAPPDKPDNARTGPVAGLTGDALLEHLATVPEGADAEGLVASIRSLVAAPLVEEVRALRAQITGLTRELEDANARLAMMREALTL